MAKNDKAKQNMGVNIPQTTATTTPGAGATATTGETAFPKTNK
ncbi:hypothetical protein [Heliobacterium chlorum]|nr:hypothetical protein [Heliobacterium chlorum]